MRLEEKDEYYAVKFEGLSLQALALEECKAHGVDFREGDFTNGNFTHTDLTGCLFGNSRLTGADFSEAKNYDIDVCQNDIKGAKSTRFEALRLRGQARLIPRVSIGAAWFGLRYVAIN